MTLEVSGGVAEWLKAAVLKIVFVKANVGSNPTSSAILNEELKVKSEKLDTFNLFIFHSAFLTIFGEMTERPKVADC